MRILIVVPAVPFPLSSGGNTAQFGIVDQLRRRHELHYAFPVKTEGDRTALADLRRHWPDVTFHPFLKDVDRGGSQLRMLERKVRCIRDAVRARVQQCGKLSGGQIRPSLPTAPGGGRETGSGLGRAHRRVGQKTAMRLGAGGIYREFRSGLEPGRDRANRVCPSRTGLGADRARTPGAGTQRGGIDRSRRTRGGTGMSLAARLRCDFDAQR